MAKADDKARLINRFVTRVFKHKRDGKSKAVVKEKLKRFISKQQKRWAASWDILFESTWRKRLPAETPKEKNQEQLALKEDQKLEQQAPKVRTQPTKLPKPPKTVKEKIRQATAQKRITIPVVKPEPVPQAEPKKGDPQRKSDNKQGPDHPLYQMTPTPRKCSRCGADYIQCDEHPNRLLCPSCDKRRGDAIEWNGIIAHENSADKNVT